MSNATDAAVMKLKAIMWVAHWNRLSELVGKGYNTQLTEPEFSELREMVIAGSQYSHQDKRGMWVPIGTIVDSRKPKR